MRTIETYVPKVVVEEKIVEVPKFVPEYVEKASIHSCALEGGRVPIRQSGFNDGFGF